MSDYVRAKVIRLPFPKDVLEKLDTENPWDCEEYLKEKLGDLYSVSRESKKFEIECTDSDWYLDYVYYYSYGDESGDFGSVSYLSDNEIKLIRPLFEKVTKNFEDFDLRKVDYCYYNCCECPDYYSIEKSELTKKDLF